MKTAKLILFVFVTGYFIAILSDKAVGRDTEPECSVDASILSSHALFNCVSTDSKMVTLCASGNNLNSMETLNWISQPQHEGVVEKCKVMHLGKWP